jgi:hypothetical protein
VEAELEQLEQLEHFANEPEQVDPGVEILQNPQVHKHDLFQSCIHL